MSKLKITRKQEEEFESLKKMLEYDTVKILNTIIEGYNILLDYGKLCGFNRTELMLIFIGEYEIKKDEEYIADIHSKISAANIEGGKAVSVFLKELGITYKDLLEIIN